MVPHSAALRRSRLRGWIERYQRPIAMNPGIRVSRVRFVRVDF